MPIGPRSAMPNEAGGAQPVHCPARHFNPMAWKYSRSNRLEKRERSDGPFFVPAPISVFLEMFFVVQGG